MEYIHEILQIAKLYRDDVSRKRTSTLNSPFFVCLFVVVFLLFFFCFCFFVVVVFFFNLLPLPDIHVV